jgi:hypothetical protein
MMILTRGCEQNNAVHNYFIMKNIDRDERIYIIYAIMSPDLTGLDKIDGQWCEATRLYRERIVIALPLVARNDRLFGANE